MKNDFHYNIALSAPQNALLWIVRAIVLCAILLLSIVLIQSFLYPKYHFNFLSHIDSLANTISRPFMTKEGTSFDIAANGNFTTAHLSITLAKDAPPLTESTVLAYHSYSAFLAPISDTKYTEHLTQIFNCEDAYYISSEENQNPTPLVSTNAAESHFFSTQTMLSADDPLCAPLKENSSAFAGFRSGTLISSPEGIFVVDGDTKHPFQDELVFQALGYDFDDVRKTSSEERSVHKKARMMTIDSAHPFGTIFYARDGERTYLYDHDLLHKIAPSAVAQNNAIVVDERSREITASCVLKRNFFSTRTYSCTIPLDTINTFPGNIFRFVINSPSVEISQSHITLSTSRTHDSLQKRITAIKKELSQYYGQSTK